MPGIHRTALFLLLTGIAALLPQTGMTQRHGHINAGSSQMDTQHPQNIRAGLNIDHLEQNIARTMKEAQAAGNTPGGVVIVVRHGETVFKRTYGNRAILPAQEPVSNNTIYDLASLTKPVATAAAVMKLIENGELTLDDPVADYISGWGSDDKNSTDSRGKITIRHLLTHTSGLPAYYRFYEKYPEGNARDKIIADIMATELAAPVGEKFIYSDLGFILLGEIVERVSSQSLADFTREHIFQPLGMNETMFTPDARFNDRIAPTSWRKLAELQSDGTTRSIIRGAVHDDNAHVQNGISGHAGLFSTGADLARFCKMILNGGELDGVRVFSPLTIATLTRDHAGLPGAGIQRGLGWDMVSTYDSPRGDLFSNGFGHTGYTGTSIWIVPEEDLAIIILTNRVHPEDRGTANPMRSRIANIVAGSIVTPHKDINPGESQ